MTDPTAAIDRQNISDFDSTSEAMAIPENAALNGTETPVSQDAFGVPTGTIANAATGIDNIDALINGLRWSSNIVTFSFTDSFTNDYEADYANAGVHSSSFSSLSLQQQAAGRETLAQFSAVASLNLVELTGANDRNATMRIAESADPVTAYAYFPTQNFVEGGDVWFNPNLYNSPQLGNYAYHTFLHEFGHALGLEHGHETGGVAGVALSSDRDSMEFSVMTYRSHPGSTLTGYTNETWGYAQTLMMYDIAAMQAMYGANFATQATDTVYTFSITTGEMFINGVGQGIPGENRVFRTVWDGDGIDTYDFSNYTTDLAVDLAPGGWSDLDVGGNFQRANLDFSVYSRGHVFNALQYSGDSRSLIENANGGSGDDVLSGNSANNLLRGNGGSDFLYGGSTDVATNTGIDTLIGGDGDDFLSGGDAVDVLYGHSSVTGGGAATESNTLEGGSGSDSLYGSDGDDVLNGGSDNDRLQGNGGSDRIDGGTGIDTAWYSYATGSVFASLGTGISDGADGRDTLINVENLSGSSYSDMLIGSSDRNVLAGNDGSDILDGRAGDDRVNGDAGNDTLLGGSGSDTLVGGSDDDSLQGYGGGINEFDILTGDLASSAAGSQSRSDGADVFLLGSSGRAFYLGNGHATITDFFWGEGDKIQVHGSQGDYTLGVQNLSGSSSSDTLIFYQSDLIGVVQDTQDVLLDTDFIFV